MCVGRDVQLHHLRLSCEDSVIRGRPASIMTRAALIRRMVPLWVVYLHQLAVSEKGRCRGKAGDVGLVDVEHHGWVATADTPVVTPASCTRRGSPAMGRPGPGSGPRAGRSRTARA